MSPPASAASIAADTVSWLRRATTNSQTQAITPTPPANPSMTSMMFSALMTPIIQRTVSARSSHSGNAAISMRMPLRISTKTAMSWPMSLDPGVSTPKSSISPSMTISVPPRTRPSTSCRNSKVSARLTRNARYTTSPPK